MRTLNFLAALLCLTAFPSYAGDGHDHGEAPAATASVVLPTVTAASEHFELVGRLGGGELSILIDRADSNEPVLGATLSVELDGRSVEAPFHADHGDYSVTDPALLAALAKPGSKRLVFTLQAGGERDQLSGEMDVHDEAVVSAAPRPGWRQYATWVAAAISGLALLYVLMRRFRNAKVGGAA